MTDDGLMIKSTSLKDVGTYECMVKKENIELRSRPAKITLEPDVTGCKLPLHLHFVIITIIINMIAFVEEVEVYNSIMI